MKDKKNILIGALVFAIVVMAIGYAAFATTLNINGSATIAGSWDVEITGIEPSIEGTASEDPASSFTASTATFAAKLMKPGDSITYTITIENKGTIDAKLNSITLTPETAKAEGGTGSDAIIYEIVSQPALDSALASGDSTTVVVKVTYDADSTEVPAETTRTFTGVIEYVQAD
jgi:hypothetical protein